MTHSMFRVYCNQKITLNRGGGADEYGEPVSIVSEIVKARVDWENKAITDNHGKEVVSVAKVSLVYDGTIDFDDTFTIDGREHPIAQINRMQDFSSNHLEIRIK